MHFAVHFCTSVTLYIFVNKELNKFTLQMYVSCEQTYQVYALEHCAAAAAASVAVVSMIAADARVSRKLGYLLKSND